MSENKEVTSRIIDGYRLLLDAGKELSTHSDRSSLLKTLVRAARQICNAEAAAFIATEGDDCLYVEEDAAAALWKGQRTSTPAWLNAALSSKEQQINDLSLCNPSEKERYHKAAIDRFMHVPIQDGNAKAVIGVYWRPGSPAGDTAAELLAHLAGLAARAIENLSRQMLLEREVEARTEESRQIADDLRSFSYSVSHDLRAPLRGINGFMEILMDEHGASLPPSALRLAERVMENARDMYALIEDLQVYFKLGHKEMFLSILPMKMLAQEIADSFMTIETGRKIQVEIADLPPARGDNMLIKQVWFNLIGNAVKYTGKKEISKIEVGYQERESSLVYFVKDNGVGFDMNYYEKLFGVFQRLHSKKDFEGTGIGLAIVQRIIARHGGELWGESVNGEGATFYFSLPSA